MSSYAVECREPRPPDEVKVEEEASFSSALVNRHFFPYLPPSNSSSSNSSSSSSSSTHNNNNNNSIASAAASSSSSSAEGTKGTMVAACAFSSHEGSSSHSNDMVFIPSVSEQCVPSSSAQVMSSIAFGFEANATAAAAGAVAAAFISAPPNAAIAQVRGEDVMLLCDDYDEVNMADNLMIELESHLPASAIEVQAPQHHNLVRTANATLLSDDDQSATVMRLEQDTEEGDEMDQLLMTRLREDTFELTSPSSVLQAGHDEDNHFFIDVFQHVLQYAPVPNAAQQQLIATFTLDNNDETDLASQQSPPNSINHDDGGTSSPQV